jgi:hypothetical protein
MYVFAYRGSFVLNLNDHYWFQPFLLAGYGGLTSLVSDSTKASAGTESFVHAGAGLQDRLHAHGGHPLRRAHFWCRGPRCPSSPR